MKITTYIDMEELLSCLSEEEKRNLFSILTLEIRTSPDFKSVRQFFDECVLYRNHSEEKNRDLQRLINVLGYFDPNENIYSIKEKRFRQIRNAGVGLWKYFEKIR